MGIHGKARLLLVGVVSVAVVLVFVFIGSAETRSQARLAATATPPQASVTATAEQVQQLKSWGLTTAEFPPATREVNATELPNYAAAGGDADKEKQVIDLGRLTGYVQQWQQDTAQFIFLNESDLFQTPAEARSWYANKPPVGTGIQIQNLADPHLGDESQMYSYTTSTQTGGQVQGYVVAWVRGRVYFTIYGYGPAGSLKSTDLLGAARVLDANAVRSPIK